MNPRTPSSAPEAPLPWLGTTISAGERILRLVVSEGPTGGRPLAGACVTVVAPDGRMRVEHKLLAEGAVLDDGFSGLTPWQAVLVAGRIERAMRQAVLVTVVQETDRALVVLRDLEGRYAGALAEADRGAGGAHES